jgi:hypothetical protein
MPVTATPVRMLPPGIVPAGYRIDSPRAGTAVAYRPDGSVLAGTYAGMGPDARAAEACHDHYNHTRGKAEEAPAPVPVPDPRALAAVKRLALDLGGDVYRRYSGRGMYGAKCLGIVCGCPDTARKSARRRKALGEPCVDNMGRDYIVYWPSLADA